MTIKNTCPKCASPVDGSMRYCRMCGLALKPAEAPVPPESVSVNCPKCGAAVYPTHKYCAKCGATLAGSAESPKTSPAVEQSNPAPGASAPLEPSRPVTAGLEQTALPGGASYQEVAANAGAALSAAGESAKRMGKQSMSMIDGMMGRSVDTSTVGSGYDPAAHTLQTSNDAELAAAFAFFNKPYQPVKPGEGVMPIASIVRRTEKETEMAAQVQAQRDFSRMSGEGAHYGGFASSLSAEAMPIVDMIDGSRAQAQKNEKVARLKHKVAVGEVGIAEAVERAKE